MCIFLRAALSNNEAIRQERRAGWMLVCSLNNVQTEDYYFIAQTRELPPAATKFFARSWEREQKFSALSFVRRSRCGTRRFLKRLCDKPEIREFRLIKPLNSALVTLSALHLKSDFFSFCSLQNCSHYYSGNFFFYSIAMTLIKYHIVTMTNPL